MFICQFWIKWLKFGYKIREILKEFLPIILTRNIVSVLLCLKPHSVTHYTVMCMDHLLLLPAKSMQIVLMYMPAVTYRHIDERGREPQADNSVSVYCARMYVDVRLICPDDHSAVGGRWVGSHCKSLKLCWLPKLIKLVSLCWSDMALQHNIFDPNCACLCVFVRGCVWISACASESVIIYPRGSAAYAKKISAPEILDFFHV